MDGPAAAAYFAMRESKHAAPSPRAELALPWQHPDLDGWSIVGMNHYRSGGIRQLFVAMARDDHCIKAEGLDLPRLWEVLRYKARRVDAADPPTPRI